MLCALTRGEVIHLIRCVPVEVSVTETTTCYTEAAVSYKNTTYYLSPRNRILKTVGTEIECNNLLPVIFKITDNWFSLYPKPQKVHNPHVLDPNPNTTWVYESPHELMEAGLYGVKEVEALQKQMLFAGEQKSLDSSVIRKYKGENINLPEGDIHNLFSGETIQKFTTSIYSKVTTGLQKVGDWTSIVIGVVFIYKLFIMVLDWIFNYLTLKGAFGKCNWRVCCFFSEGIVNFIFSRRQEPGKPTTDKELSEINPATSLYPPIPSAPIRTPPSSRRLLHIGDDKQLP